MSSAQRVRSALFFSVSVGTGKCSSRECWNSDIAFQLPRRSQIQTKMQPRSENRKNPDRRVINRMSCVRLITIALQKSNGRYSRRSEETRGTIISCSVFHVDSPLKPVRRIDTEFSSFASGFPVAPYMVKPFHDGQELTSQERHYYLQSIGNYVQVPFNELFRAHNFSD